MLLHLVASPAVVPSTAGDQQHVPESCACGQAGRGDDLPLNTEICDDLKGQRSKLWDPGDLPGPPGPATSLPCAAEGLLLGRAAGAHSSSSISSPAATGILES